MMTTSNEDRIYLMWKARRKSRAMNGWCVTGAAYDVARRFKISCARVREIVAEQREVRRG